MTLHVIPGGQGFIYVPAPGGPADKTQRGKVAHGRGLITQAAKEAEDYLVDNGYPPYELATLDVKTRCVVGWWRQDVGGVSPDYPGAELVVYVNVPLPGASSDFPPAQPAAAPISPDAFTPGPGRRPVP